MSVSTNFTGSMPEYYDSILGPAQLENIAAELVRRLPAQPKGDVLELACGTGIVTRRLRERVDPRLRLVATDLSKSMVDYASNKLRAVKGIEWREADAAALPFRDGSFGAVVCGFGVMFVPDKKKLFGEIRRVLGAGGTLLFDTWDRLELNPHGKAGAEVFEALFPGDPEMQFTRIPFGFHDHALIRNLLDEARFGEIRFEPLESGISCPSARTYATGQVRGTPRSSLIQQKGADLEAVIDKLAAALARYGGAEPFSCRCHAIVVQAKAL